MTRGQLYKPTQMLFVKTGWLPLLQRLRWQNVQTGGREKFLTKVVCHVLRSWDPTVALARWWHNQWKCEKMLQISDHLDPPCEVTEDNFCNRYYRYICYRYFCYTYLTTWTFPVKSLRTIFVTDIFVIDIFVTDIWPPGPTLWSHQRQLLLQKYVLQIVLLVLQISDHLDPTLWSHWECVFLQSFCYRIFVTDIWQPGPTLWCHWEWYLPWL